MMWFLGSTLILVCIAAIMILSGLFFLYALHRARYGKTEWSVGSEEFALAALVGTALWIMLCSSLSYAGFTFSQIRFAIIPVLAVIGILSFTRWPRYRTPGADLQKAGIISGLGILAGIISFLPLALKNAFNLLGDPFTYVIIADYLKTHSFLTPINTDISHPYLGQVWIYQMAGLRMGSNFLLALVTSMSSNLRAVDVYPAVRAWGIVLVTFALFLFMRWGLRAPHRIAFLAAFFLGVTPNTIQTSALYGFFPQTFGIANFFFSAAILARIIRRSSFSLDLAILLGLSWAFQVSVYGELFPVLAIASMIPLLFAFVRYHSKRKTFQLVKVLAVFLVTWVALSNYELVRFVRAIPIQLKATVGWTIAPDYLGLWSAALSAKPFEMDWSWAFALSSVILSCLFILSLWRLAKTKQIVPISLLCTFALLTIYFGSSIRADPYNSLWRIYKVSQWSTLLFIALSFWALKYVRFLTPKTISAIVVLTCVLGMAPLTALFDRQTELMQTYTGSTTPFQDYFELASLIHKYNKPMAYQVNYPGYLPAVLPAYFLMNYPVQGKWDGFYISGPSQATSLPAISTTLFYCLDCPFPNRRNPLLPAKSVVIQQPVISDVRLIGYQSTISGLVFPITESKRVCLTVFSIRAGPGNMVLSGDLRKATFSSATLRISGDGGWQTEAAISENHDLTINIPLQTGENRFCFESNRAISVSISDLYLVSS